MRFAIWEWSIYFPKLRIMLTLDICLSFIKTFTSREISRYFNGHQLSSLFPLQLSHFSSCYTSPHRRWHRESHSFYIFKKYDLGKIQLGIHLVQVQWDTFIMVPSHCHAMASYPSIRTSFRNFSIAHCASSPDIMTQRLRTEILS